MSTAAAVAAAGCSGNKARTAPTSFAQVDGVYHRNVSAVANARHDGVAIAENYGDFVLVIKHGHFAFTQHNAKACTWQYGTLRMRGSRMDWLFTDGGGKAPNNAENKPGEHFVWRASLFRGALTLVPVTPTDIERETWHQTSRTPTADALTAACRPPAAALPR